MKITGKRLLNYYFVVDIDHKLKRKNKRLNTKSIRRKIKNG